MIVSLWLVTALLGGPPPQNPRDGEDLIRLMHERYAGKWYRTLTFIQTTKFPDGRVETWYEALQFPGLLRIDIAPLDSGRALIFRNDSLYQFNRNVQTAGQPLVHPLMVLGFDVYADQPENTIRKLKGLNFDLGRIQPGTWQGKNVWIVGTDTPGDSTTPQFWITQDHLLFVRMLQKNAQGGISETRFNRYFQIGGGWVAPEVLFFTNGRPGLVEEYDDVKVGMEFAPELFDPSRFARPGWVR